MAFRNIDHYAGFDTDTSVPLEEKLKYIDETFEQYVADEDYAYLSDEEKAQEKQRFIREVTGSKEDSWPEVVGKSVAKGALGPSRLLAHGGRVAKDVAGLEIPGAERHALNVEVAEQVIGEPQVQPGGLKATVGSALESGTQMGAHYLTTAGLGTLPAMSAEVGTGKYLEARKEGFSKTRSGVAGTITALGEYVTEKTPFKILTTPQKKFLNRLAQGYAWDVPGEMLATLNEMWVVDEGILGKDYTKEEYITAMIDTAKVAATMTTGATGIAHGVHKTSDLLTSKPAPEGEQEKQKEAAAALDRKNQTQGGMPINQQAPSPDVGAPPQEQLGDWTPPADQVQPEAPAPELVQEEAPTEEIPVEAFVNTATGESLDIVEQGDDFKIRFPETEKKLWEEAVRIVTNRINGLKTPASPDVAPMAGVIETVMKTMDVAVAGQSQMKDKQRRLIVRNTVLNQIKDGYLVMPKNAVSASGNEVGLMTHVLSLLDQRKAWTRQSQMPAPELETPEAPVAEAPVEPTAPVAEAPIEEPVAPEPTPEPTPEPVKMREKDKDIKFMEEVPAELDEAEFEIEGSARNIKAGLEGFKKNTNRDLNLKVTRKGARALKNLGWTKDDNGAWTSPDSPNVVAYTKGEIPTRTQRSKALREEIGELEKKREELKGKEKSAVTRQITKLRKEQTENDEKLDKAVQVRQIQKGRKPVTKAKPAETTPEKPKEPEAPKKPEIKDIPSPVAVLKGKKGSNEARLRKQLAVMQEIVDSGMYKGNKITTRQRNQARSEINWMQSILDSLETRSDKQATNETELIKNSSGMNLVDFAKQYVKLTDNKWGKIIVKRLIPFLNPKDTYHYIPYAGAYGVFSRIPSPDNGRLIGVLGISQQNWKPSKKDTIVHELIHAATSHIIHRYKNGGTILPHQEKPIKELMALHRKIMTKLNAKIKALPEDSKERVELMEAANKLSGSSPELLAYGTTSTSVQKTLRSLGIEPSGLRSKLADLVRRLFKLPVKATVIDDVMRLTEEIAAVNFEGGLDSTEVTKAPKETKAPTQKKETGAKKPSKSKPGKLEWFPGQSQKEEQVLEGGWVSGPTKIPFNPTLSEQANQRKVYELGLMKLVKQGKMPKVALKSFQEKSARLDKFLHGLKPIQINGKEWNGVYDPSTMGPDFKKEKQEHTIGAHEDSNGKTTYWVMKLQPALPAKLTSKWIEKDLARQEIEQQVVVFPNLKKAQKWIQDYHTNKVYNEQLVEKAKEVKKDEVKVHGKKLVRVGEQDPTVSIRILPQKQTEKTDNKAEPLLNLLNTPGGVPEGPPLTKKQVEANHTNSKAIAKKWLENGTVFVKTGDEVVRVEKGGTLPAGNNVYIKGLLEGEKIGSRKKEIYKTGGKGKAKGLKNIKGTQEVPVKMGYGPVQRAPYVVTVGAQKYFMTEQERIEVEQSAHEFAKRLASMPTDHALYEKTSDIYQALLTQLATTGTKYEFADKEEADKMAKRLRTEYTAEVKTEVFPAFDRRVNLDITDQLPVEGTDLPKLGAKAAHGRPHQTVWVPFEIGKIDYTINSPYEFSIVTKRTDQHHLEFSGSSKLAAKYAVSLQVIAGRAYKKKADAVEAANDVLRLMVEMESGKERQVVGAEESDFLLRKKAPGEWYVRLKAKFGGKQLTAPHFIVMGVFDKNTNTVHYQLKRKQFGKKDKTISMGTLNKQGKFVKLVRFPQVKPWLAKEAKRMGGFENIISDYQDGDTAADVFARTEAAQDVQYDIFKKPEATVASTQDARHAGVLIRELKDRLKELAKKVPTEVSVLNEFKKVEEAKQLEYEARIKKEAAELTLEDMKDPRMGKTAAERTKYANTKNEAVRMWKDAQNNTFKAELKLRAAQAKADMAVNTKDGKEHTFLDTHIKLMEQAAEEGNMDQVFATFQRISSMVENVDQRLWDKSLAIVQRKGAFKPDERETTHGKARELQARDRATEESKLLTATHPDGLLGYEQDHSNWAMDAAQDMDGRVMYSRTTGDINFAVIETQDGAAVNYMVVEFNDRTGKVQELKDIVLTNRLFGKEVEGTTEGLQELEVNIKHYSPKITHTPGLNAEVKVAIEALRAARPEMKAERIPQAKMKDFKQAMGQILTDQAFKDFFSNPKVTLFNSAKEMGGDIVAFNPRTNELFIAVSSLSDLGTMDPVLEGLARVKIYRDGILDNGILKDNAKIKRALNNKKNPKLQKLLAKEKQRLSNVKRQDVILDEVLVKYMANKNNVKDPLWKMIVRATKAGMTEAGIRKPNEAQAVAYLKQALKYEEVPYRNDEKVDNELDFTQSDMMAIMGTLTEDTRLDEEIEQKTQALREGKDPGNLTKSTLTHRALGWMMPFQWRAEEFKAVRQKKGFSLEEGFHKVYEFGNKFRGRAQRAIHQEMKTLSGLFKKDENSEHFRALNHITHVLDAIKVRPASLPQKYTTKEDATGNSILQTPVDEYYVALGEYIKDNFPEATQEVIDDYLQVRRVLDKNIVDLYNDVSQTRRELGERDNKVIKTFMDKAGMIEFYFPHMRFGDQFIELKYEGETVYRTQFDKPTMAARAKQLYNKDFGKLTSEEVAKMFVEAADSPLLEGKTLDWGKVTIDGGPVENENMYNLRQNQIPLDIMEQIYNDTTSRLETMFKKEGVSKENMPKFLQVLKDEMAHTTVRKTGMKGFLTERKDIPGHTTKPEDYKRILLSYVMGMNSARSNMAATVKFGEELGKVDWKSNPEEYRVADKYISKYFRESNKMINFTKKLMFFKYLGWNMQTIMLNATQPIVTGLPRLASDAGITDSAGLEVARGYIDNARDMYNRAYKDGSVTDKNMQELIDLVLESGELSDQMLQEMMGETQKLSDVQSGLSKMVKASGKWMGYMERMNRGTMLMAAYNMARAGKIKNKQVTDRFKVPGQWVNGKYVETLQPGQKFSHEQAMEYAREVNSYTQFNYGRDNMPEIFAKHPVMELGYIFQSFPLHMMFALRHYAHHGGARGRAAIAMTLASMFMLGGEEAAESVLPFKYLWYDPIMKWAFGPEWKVTHRKWLEEMTDTQWATAITKGLPAAFGGADLSGPMSVSLMPPVRDDEKFENQMIEFLFARLGPVGGTARDAVRAVEAASQGNLKQAMYKVAPKSWANVAKAVFGSEELGGRVETSTGKPLRKMGSREDYAYTWLPNLERTDTVIPSAVFKMFGMTPSGEAQIHDFNSAYYLLQNLPKNHAKKLASWYSNGWIDKKTTMKLVREFNKDPNHPKKINPRTIMKTIKDKPRRLDRGGRRIKKYLD